MDRAIYVAMTGAINNMHSQTSHSNNLANASTYGFKSDLAQARAVPVWGDHYASRAFSLTERPASDFDHGALVETGNDLDVAAGGDGFFAVLDAEGQEAYTRRGDFSVSPLGELVNGAGQPVLGQGGPILLPAYDKLDISNDGVISIRPSGAGPDQMIVVDALKLVTPDLTNFEKFEDGLFRPRSGNAALDADPTLTVVSGFVENSNVNAVSELTNILALSRQYETQVKMMKTADEMSRTSERILQLS